MPYPRDLDVVVRFAAHAKVHELVQQPARALENITMTFNVPEFCRHNDLPIIFSSSREVYGDIRCYITEESSADFAFTGKLSASKISGEALDFTLRSMLSPPLSVFRFSNVYGRYDVDIGRMERVIPSSSARSLGQPITVFGEDKVLDFTLRGDDCVGGFTGGSSCWPPAARPTKPSIWPTAKATA